MKVCILSTMFLRYKNDTRGLSIYEFSKGIVKEGIEVSVVAPNDNHYPSYEEMEGIRINRFHYFFPVMEKVAYGSGIPTNLRKSLSAKLQLPLFMLFFLIKALKECKKADVIHCQWVLSGIVGVIAGKMTGKPVCYTERRIAVPSRLQKFLTRYVINNSDFVFFNSTFTKDEAMEFCSPKSYSVARPTVDTEKFRPSIKNELRRELGISRGTKVLFSLGLLVRKKGFSYLIKAMKLLKSSNAVLIIGGEGSERNNLEQLIERLGLNGKIRLVGMIEANKTPSYFNIADVFILPSIIDDRGETETLGVVLLESLACGCPVIASDVGGIPDVVTKETGILVSQKDPEALARAIDAILLDDKKRKRMGSAGRKMIEKKFTFDKVSKQFTDVYTSLASCLPSRKG